MYSPPCEGKPVQIKWSPHWRAADWNFRGISSGHVAVGFMPAFKHNQRILLAVFERGHKAHGYVHCGTFRLTWTAESSGPDAAVFPVPSRSGIQVHNISPSKRVLGSLVLRVQLKRRDEDVRFRRKSTNPFRAPL